MSAVRVQTEQIPWTTFGFESDGGPAPALKALAVIALAAPSFRLHCLDAEPGRPVVVVFEVRLAPAAVTALLAPTEYGSLEIEVLASGPLATLKARLDTLATLATLVRAGKAHR
jgi:hypothetical protein